MKTNMSKLAIVETTQSGEVIFTLIGGLILFHNKVPTIGIGMILNSIMGI